MNLELERFLETQTEMLGNLTITDSIDIETLTDICEEYHKRKLKLLGIGDVGCSLPNKEELLSVYEKTIEEKHKGLNKLEREWIKLGFIYYHRYLSDKNKK